MSKLKLKGKIKSLSRNVLYLINIDDEELKKKEDHLTILKQQHERIQDIYLNKMKKLEEELRTTNDKLKTTEDKTKVEISSLKSQIKM